MNRVGRGGKSPKKREGRKKKVELMLEVLLRDLFRNGHFRYPSYPYQIMQCVFLAM